MRILVVTNMYPPHHYGGYEINCAEAVAHWRSQGHHVEVLTSDWRVPGVEDPRVEAGVHRALRLYWRDHDIVRPSLLGCLRLERANQAALAELLDRVRPDLVSVWHMGCVSLGLLASVARRGLPVVHVVHDDWLVYGPIVDRWTHVGRRLGSLGRGLARASGLPPPDHDVGGHGLFAFVSEHTRSRADQAPWTLGRTTTTWCGINTDDFPPVGPEADRRARDSWSWRLLHVGRIDERKGVDVAIRALARLPETATLELLGRGDDAHLAELHALAEELGVADRVRIDVADRSGLAERYVAADVVLFPPRWEEPFGLVPVEAMACGTPVVATGTGGSDEFLLHEGNCLRVPVDDDEALAAAVTRLAEDGELRGRLVARGRATVPLLTLGRWLDGLDAWHRAEVGAEAPPASRPALRDEVAAVAGP